MKGMLEVRYVDDLGLRHVTFVRTLAEYLLIRDRFESAEIWKEVSND